MGTASAKQPPVFIKNPLITLMLVILALLAVLAWWWASNVAQLPNPLASGPSMPTSGTLMLTTSNTDPNKIPVIAYNYTFADSKLAEMPVNMGAYPGQELTLQYTLSPDNTWLTFIAVRPSSPEAPLSGADAVAQVYRTQVTGPATPAALAALADNATPITSTLGTKSFPSIADDGSVLYAEYQGSAADLATTTLAESWSIVLVPTDGSAPQTLTSGMSPKWVDSQHFLFLKNDGLYLYSLADKSEIPVADVGGTVTMATTMDLSKDGTMVVWSSPAANEIGILSAHDWANDTPDIRTATFSGTTPVFSPDGSEFAIVSSARNDDTGAYYPIVRIFNTQTFAPVNNERVIDLPDFGVDKVQLSDWTE